MITVKCDMCGKDITNDTERTTFRFPHEETISDYDICGDCSNKIEEFIKESYKYYCEPITPEEKEAMDKWKEGPSKTAMFKKDQNECNREKCEGCESFIYTSSPIYPDKLHIGCNKTNHFRIVDLEHTAKPEDFYEEEK